MVNVSSKTTEGPKSQDVVGEPTCRGDDWREGGTVQKSKPVQDFCGAAWLADGA